MGAAGQQKVHAAFSRQICTLLVSERAYIGQCPKQCITMSPKGGCCICGLAPPPAAVRSHHWLCPTMAFFLFLKHLPKDCSGEMLPQTLTAVFGYISRYEQVSMWVRDQKQRGGSGCTPCQLSTGNGRGTSSSAAAARGLQLDGPESLRVTAHPLTCSAAGFAAGSSYIAR